jgi:hypothetical protein
MPVSSVAMTDIICRDGRIFDEGQVLQNCSGRSWISSNPAPHVPGRPSTPELTGALEPGELFVVCPNCGDEFAATGPRTATENVARHLHGDVDEDHAPNCRSKAVHR